MPSANAVVSAKGSKAGEPAVSAPPSARPSFRERVHQAREDAIVASVNRLLAEKGFDLMTVDEVAADVGIAKASLYKHFASKEALAAAAMVRVMDDALAQIERQAQVGGVTPLGQLREMTRWALLTLLGGRMPLLPAENSSLRATLLADKAYLDRLMELSERLGEWITAAQDSGELNPALPPEAVLYSLFSRACDPVPGFLKATGQYDDERIVQIVLAATFDGLAAPRA